MQLERETTTQFVKYLKEHGYPEKSIAIEFRIGPNSIVDVAILDLEKNIPIQIFEIKSIKNDATIKQGTRQLKRYLESLGDRSVPAYLVFPSQSHPYFEVQNVSQDIETIGIMDSDTISILNYHAQRNSRIAELANKVEDKKKKEVDRFGMTCIAIAVTIGLSWGIARFFSFEITATDLSIWGGIIVLILIPYSNKIKVLGIEFERLTKEKKEKV